MQYRITLFSSGNGSNVENIIKYFKGSKIIRIEMVICNNEKAFVIQRVKKYNIPIKIISNSTLKNNDLFFCLKRSKTTHIILAGFMNLIPKSIINYYKNKIINIHPSLLPKYGGKGFHGENVHKAVLYSGDKRSGITIHIVNEEYDKGKIIFQKLIIINNDETLESLSSKIHDLEYKYFPQIIEKYILNKL